MRLPTMNPRAKKSLMIQIVIVLIALIILFPIIYALSVSFMNDREILSRTPHFFPTKVTMDNYVTAWTRTLLPRYIVNSFIVAIVCSVSRILLGSMAAYAFSFFEFKGKKLLFGLVLSTMMIPMDVLIISNYTTVSNMGLLNTYIGICILFLVNGNNIFLLKQEFTSFSASIREAAMMDGCGSVRFFFSILMPVNKPILTTVFISSFVGIWNQYVWPMLVTNKDEMRTVQVGITMLKNWDSTKFGPVMAGVIIALIPTILIIVLFQKQIVGGMTSGAVKG